MKIPEGYLPLLQKIEKNLNEDDLKLLQEIGKGNLPDKDVIKKLCIKMTSGLNFLEKAQLGKMFLYMGFKGNG